MIYVFARKNRVVIVGYQHPTDQPVKHSVKHDRGMIYMDETPVMLTRGWGHLTGCGALNLPGHEAAKIQDDFGEWIVKKLKQEI